MYNRALMFFCIFNFTYLQNIIKKTELLEKYKLMHL